MKILIAEDDITSKAMLEVVTRKWGYEPICVADGESALEIMQQDDHPLLLLFDWEMPNLSGVELCRKIRAQEKDDPAFIILLTSRTSTEDIVTGLEAGANEYIAKPFDHAELQARLQVGKRMLDLQYERQRAEGEKARLRRELEQTRKMEALGQITGSIAHDFNNILGITMGYTSMALDRFGNEIPDKMKQYLETAMKSSERAKELVKKMMTYSHSDIQMPDPLDVVTVCEQYQERLLEALPDSISIEITSGENIPNILITPAILHQLLRILCDNAKDATEGNGIIKIDIRQAEIVNGECSDCHKLIEGDWIELSVSDSGTGMSDKVIERIFEPFYTTKEFGKGMGMAMLHGIITRIDGHSLIESTLGKGSEIRLLFPPA